MNKNRIGKRSVNSNIRFPKFRPFTRVFTGRQARHIQRNFLNLRVKISRYALTLNIRTVLVRVFNNFIIGNRNRVFIRLRNVNIRRLTAIFNVNKNLPVILFVIKRRYRPVQIKRLINLHSYKHHNWHNHRHRQHGNHGDGGKKWIPRRLRVFRPVLHRDCMTKARSGARWVLHTNLTTVRLAIEPLTYPRTFRAPKVHQFPNRPIAQTK